MPMNPHGLLLTPDNGPRSSREPVFSVNSISTPENSTPENAKPRTIPEWLLEAMAGGRKKRRSFRRSRR